MSEWAEAAPPDELADVCRAVGLKPSAEQLGALSGYLDLLDRWNGTYNLTAVRQRADMVTQHLADCLAVLPALARHRSGGRLLDVGSGGGLPGVVIAIMLPGWDVSCVDAVGKKAAFVRQVAGALKLKNLHALHARVESLRAPPFDLITSRAFASLADFTRLSTPLLAKGGAWLAMKGQVPDAEIAALPVAVEMFHVEPLTVPDLDAQRCLVWMRPEHTEMKYLNPAATVLACCSAATALAQTPPLAALPALDVPAYMGTWYQVAWFPNGFQKQCVKDTTATYRRLPEGGIEVLNRCRRADGSIDDIVGLARPAGSVLNGDRLEPARLEVSFLPAALRWLPIWGAYWVIQLADDGHYAVVSEAERKYLWVLARTPQLAPADETAIRSRLVQQGFDLARWQAHPHTPPAEAPR